MSNISDIEGSIQTINQEECSSSSSASSSLHSQPSPTLTSSVPPFQESMEIVACYKEADNNSEAGFEITHRKRKPFPFSDVKLQIFISKLGALCP